MFAGLAGGVGCARSAHAGRVAPCHVGDGEYSRLGSDGPCIFTTAGPWAAWSRADRRPRMGRRRVRARRPAAAAPTAKPRRRRRARLRPAILARKHGLEPRPAHTIQPLGRTV
ncbi:hypothetical protein LG3211_2754 [Lysobacter gummosus]|nr:hypothetical protein LG3211_2754 [Lysobacter gummosus]